MSEILRDQITEFRVVIDNQYSRVLQIASPMSALVLHSGRAYRVIA
jgi:hypothetical protein